MLTHSRCYHLQSLAFAVGPETSPPPPGPNSTSTAWVEFAGFFPNFGPLCRPTHLPTLSAPCAACPCPQISRPAPTFWELMLPRSLCRFRLELSLVQVLRVSSAIPLFTRWGVPHLSWVPGYTDPCASLHQQTTTLPCLRLCVSMFVLVRVRVSAGGWVLDGVVEVAAARIDKE